MTHTASKLSSCQIEPPSQLSLQNKQTKVRKIEKRAIVCLLSSVSVCFISKNCVGVTLTEHQVVSIAFSPHLQTELVNLICASHCCFFTVKLFRIDCGHVICTMWCSLGRHPFGVSGCGVVSGRCPLGSTLFHFGWWWWWSVIRTLAHLLGTGFNTNRSVLR